MMVTPDGTMIGSVSGGCVEASVVREAMELLQTKGDPKHLTYGVTNEDAWTVGLSCGGKIDIWLERVSDSPIWQDAVRMIRSNLGFILVTGLEQKINQKGIYTNGALEGIEPTDSLPADCQQAYEHHRTQVAGGYFLNVFPAKSRLIIIGAAHVSLDLINLAKLYNFETLVIDPRGIFTDERRFSAKPDQMYTDWPAEVLPSLKLDADTYVVVLTHDPKIDDQALQIVLASKVAYVGALGSSKTHAKRVARLQQSGVSSEQIDRIHGPVGVNINARQPSEIALSIMAEIIATKNKYL
jgi:xanthine dehydrogenase accessory factor